MNISSNFKINQKIVNFKSYFKNNNSARKNNEHSKLGYPEKSGMSPSHSYNISKIAVIAITGIQQREIDRDTTRTGINVNAMCPGYCKTDMARGGGFSDQGIN